MGKEINDKTMAYTTEQMREYKREWRKRPGNREAERAYQRKRYAENPAVREYQKAYHRNYWQREDVKERRNARRRELYASSPEFREKMAEYNRTPARKAYFSAHQKERYKDPEKKAAHNAYCRAYNKAHREQLREYLRRWKLKKKAEAAILTESPADILKPRRIK